MDNLLNTQQAAAYLGCGIETLKQARCTGVLFGRDAPKFIKLGHRTVRYQRQTLEAWVSGAPEVGNTAAARRAVEQGRLPSEA